jgi:hypothetical protein
VEASGGYWPARAAGSRAGDGRHRAADRTSGQRPPGHPPRPGVFLDSIAELGILSPLLITDRRAAHRSGVRFTTRRSSRPGANGRAGPRALGVAPVPQRPRRIHASLRITADAQRRRDRVVDQLNDAEEKFAAIWACKAQVLEDGIGMP